MIWILATRGASTKLVSSPYTETPIEGVHSVVYKPGITPIAYTGQEGEWGPAGTFDRGLWRISGYVFSYHGLVAETLFALEDDIDLIIRYRANTEKRKRTLKEVIFLGDAVVTVPGLNTGVSELIGVPFRVQFPEQDDFEDHVVDEEDE